MKTLCLWVYNCGTTNKRKPDQIGVVGNIDITLSMIFYSRIIFGRVCDLLILHLIFADSEIEDTDNESDDNRGCVCVILWTRSVRFWSAILTAITD